MHSKSFDDLIPHMKGAGFLATVCAASITAMFGWELGENFAAKIATSVLLALCTFIVGYALTAAHQAYKRGMRVVGHMAVALFSIAAVAEFIAGTGFQAANRSATIADAGAQTVTYQNANKNVSDLEAKLSRQQKDRAAMAPMDGQAAVKPWRSPQDAAAAVASAEAHRWFTGKTEGCSKTFGNDTRNFCKTYQEAKADVQRWADIAKLEITIGETEEALRKARSDAGLVKVGHAAAASQGRILSAMATANENPTESAQFWTQVGIASLLSVFAMAASGLLNFIAFAFDGPSQSTKREIATERATEAPRTVVQREFVREPKGTPMSLLEAINGGMIAAH